MDRGSVTEDRYEMRDTDPGRPSLKPHGKDDPMDTTDVDSTYVWTQPIEPPTDDLLAAKYKTFQKVPGIQSCILCHGQTIGPRILGNFGETRSAFLQDEP